MWASTVPTLSRPTCETSRSRASSWKPDSSSGWASTPVTSCDESHVSISSRRSARSSGDSVSRPASPSTENPERVRHCESDRLSAQNFFVASSSTPSSATSVFALRSTADAGLFSSCARPAASRPSEAIFSSSSSLDLNTRARSTITCTSTVVSSSHSWISRGRSAAGIASIVVRSSATTSPGGALMREYGSMPVTSPPCHSMTMCGPEPRSTRIRRWPSSTMKRPLTGPVLGVSTAPGSSVSTWPVSTSQAS